MGQSDCVFALINSIVKVDRFAFMNHIAVIQFARGSESKAMSETVTIRGRYENRTFIPSEPMPPVEGEAELIVRPTVAPEPTPRFAVPPPKHSPEEFIRLLNEMAHSPPTRSLPSDWSRADLYDDHD